LLIHHFHPKKGGNQKKDGWEDLAARLQKEGYAVLTFDFRGFGDSKTVDPEFWKHPHNNANIRGKRVLGKAPPTSIDHKDFNPGYWRYLVNDIAAAKSYLDRRNDDAELNTSSTIVIGAGDGAALGALWMAHECRLKRDKNPPPMPGIVALPNLADSEGKDLACAIWLSISPGIAGQNAPVGTWLKYVGKESKVPMAFVYGSQDERSKTFATNMLKSIKGGATPKKGGLTGPHELKTKLFGSALLQSKLDTEDWIATTYLESVMEKRGDKERRVRAIEKWRYFYDFRSPVGAPGRGLIPVKPGGEEVQRVILSAFFPIR
jgi:hypothetical protein